MSKTVLQAIVDEIHYPVSSGNLENKLITRGLDGGLEFTKEIAISKEYKGAIADCLASLVSAPNFTEGDVTISLSDKDKITNIANSIYRSIGEEFNVITDSASVTIM